MFSLLVLAGIVGALVALIFIIMEMNQNKTSALDFFLHLGAIVALYAVTISFLNLIFKIVNKAFPEVQRNYYAWGGSSEISMPVATLIVVFPLFVALSRFVYKTYEQNPEKKEMHIRKWLVYITLFIAGIILAGDLVTVLYKFLDGQDLTVAFLLKALAVLLVAGAVFGYYLQDIRDRISSRRRKMWTIVVGLAILISIILGFAILGSPRTQRLIRYDAQKVSDLQSIQWQVISYWQEKGVIPVHLGELEGMQQYYRAPLDSQFEKEYEYRKTGEMTFELCADFNKETPDDPSYGSYPYYERSAAYPTKGGIIQNDNWQHSAGRQCFQREIDPVAYPTRVRG